MHYKKANNKMISDKEKIILKELYVGGNITIDQLAKKTQYSKSKINKIIKQLNLKDLIVIDRGNSKGGRKPQLVSLRNDLFLSLGIDIGHNYIRAIILKNDGVILTSHVLKRKAISPNLKSNPDLEKITNHILKKVNLTIDKINCIGIGISGFIDEFNGKCLFLDATPEWRNFSVKKFYEKKFNNRFILVKDSTNTMAAGERFLGECKDENNFIYLNVGMGIGASIYCFGKQVTGWNGLASELGHIDIGSENIRCSCGNFGCLETIAGGWAIEGRCKSALRSGTISLLNDCYDDIEKVSVSSILKAAHEDDKLSISLIKDSAIIMGKSISMLINLLNPNRIVLSGGIVKGAPSFFIEYMTQEALAHVLPWLRTSVNLSISKLGQFDSAIGAAMLVIEEHFNEMLNDY